jgi:hypothetical protein
MLSSLIINGWESNIDYILDYILDDILDDMNLLYDIKRYWPMEFNIKEIII